MKCWWTMPMPAAMASRGLRKVRGHAVDEDLALVRLQQAVELVHQGGLAGAVLAEQGVDLAGLDGQVDVVVGHQVAEALGDAAQFESQRNLLDRRAGDRWTRDGRAAARPRVVTRGRAAAGCYLPEGHFGALADSTFTVPAMMSAFSLSTSALRPASTLLSNWLYGASETPLFSSVPR